MQFILFLMTVGLVAVRSSSLLRTLFRQQLNSIGLQLGDHIYTPISLIHYPRGTWFDLVLLGHHQHRLHGYRILHRDYFDIGLHHVPVGHKLTYLHQGEQKEVPYMPGTPFQLRKGELVLHQKKKKGLGFIHEEVSRGTQWPLK